MAIIPSRMSGAQVDPTGKYRCSLCKSQTAGDRADTGWVRCPMLDDRPICLGCCVDYQAVARAEDFDGHPFRELFGELARLTGSSPVDLRRRCLEHQASILRTVPALPADDDDARAVAGALAGLPDQ